MKRVQGQAEEERWLRMFLELGEAVAALDVHSMPFCILRLLQSIT